MWIIAATTFGLVFSIICGLYWLLVVRPESDTRDALHRRLRRTRTADDPRVGLVKEVKRLSSVPALQTLLGRTGFATNRLQALIDSADVQISVGRFVVGSALLAGVVYLAAFTYLQRPGVALVLAMLACPLPYFWLSYKRTTRLRAFEEQFPDAIDLIARAMRAGHGLTTGLGMVADEMPAPAGREFKLIYDWQNFGMSLPEALQKFAQRTPLLDARFFVTSVLTQRDSGGNLSEVLDNLSVVIRERFRVKRQIRVLSTHGRMTGLVLGALPPFLALYFMVTKPDYLGGMLADPRGVRVLLAAIGLQVMGVLIIRRIVNIEY
jgi:tight adherence protein B